MTYFQNTVAISLLSFWQAHFKNTYTVQTEPQSDTASHTASTQWTVTENNKAAPRLEATEMRLTLLFIIACSPSCESTGGAVGYSWRQSVVIVFCSGALHLVEVFSGPSWSSSCWHGQSTFGPQCLTEGETAAQMSFQHLPTHLHLCSLTPLHLCSLTESEDFGEAPCPCPLQSQTQQPPTTLGHAAPSEPAA